MVYCSLGSYFLSCSYSSKPALFPKEINILCITGLYFATNTWSLEIWSGEPEIHPDGVLDVIVPFEKVFDGSKVGCTNCSFSNSVHFIIIRLQKMQRAFRNCISLTSLLRNSLRKWLFFQELLPSTRSIIKFAPCTYIFTWLSMSLIIKGMTSSAITLSTWQWGTSPETSRLLSWRIWEVLLQDLRSCTLKPGPHHIIPG